MNKGDEKLRSDTLEYLRGRIIYARGQRDVAAGKGLLAEVTYHPDGEREARSLRLMRDREIELLEFAYEALGNVLA